jgi:hypothetical protein
VLALPELLYLAALIVAFGIITCGAAFTDAMLWILKKTVGSIPLIGGIIVAPATVLLQGISHSLGGYADTIGAGIASNWHFLATIVDRVGWTMFHLGLSIERLYTYVTLVYPLHLLWATANEAYSLASRAGHAVGNTTFVTKVIRDTIVLPGHSALAPSIRSLFKPFTTELHQFEAWARHAIAVGGQEVIALPGQIGSIPKQLGNIRARLGALEKIVAAGVTVALVGAALRHMGLNFLRCSNVAKTAKSLCGMRADLLEGLLLGTVLIASPLSVETFARACQFVEDDVMGAIEYGVPELRKLSV